MATVKLGSYGSTTSVLTTELNSLANAALSSASASYDNSANLNTLCAIEIVIAAQGSARSVGATVTVFMSASATGTAQDNTVESPIAMVFPLDAATTARTHTFHNVPLTPSSSAKFTLLNSTGQALAASGNTVKVVPYTVTVA